MKRTLTCLGTAIALAATCTAMASSHREAPFVTKYPQADGTDFYLFKSYEPGREDFVTMIANVCRFVISSASTTFASTDPAAQSPRGRNRSGTSTKCTRPYGSRQRRHSTGVANMWSRW